MAVVVVHSHSIPTGRTQHTVVASRHEIFDAMLFPYKIRSRVLEMTAICSVQDVSQGACKLTTVPLLRYWLDSLDFA